MIGEVCYLDTRVNLSIIRLKETDVYLMSRRTQTDEKEMKRIIAEYVQAYGVGTTREVVTYVYGVMGKSPSTATVAKILKDLGYEPMRAWERKGEE